MFISARLQNRNSQGQCYANLAYAYSQLGDLMKSKQAFDHALLAAEDTGIYISIILSVFNQFVNFYSIFNHHSC